MRVDGTEGFLLTTRGSPSGLRWLQFAPVERRLQRECGLTECGQTNSCYTDSGLSDSGYTDSDSKDAAKGNADYRNAAKRNDTI